MPSNITYQYVRCYINTDIKSGVMICLAGCTNWIDSPPVKNGNPPVFNSMYLNLNSDSQLFMEVCGGCISQVVSEGGHSSMAYTPQNSIGGFYFNLPDGYPVSVTFDTSKSNFASLSIPTAGSLYLATMTSSTSNTSESDNNTYAYHDIYITVSKA